MAAKSKGPRATRKRVTRDRLKRPPRKPATPGKTPRSGSKRTLIRRLYRAIDTKLRHMEARMQSELEKPDAGATSAADHERDARSIGTLIKNLEKVTEIESAASRSTRATDDARALADEADRLRAELAERLQRLCAPREV